MGLFSKNTLLAIASVAVVIYLFIPIPSGQDDVGPDVTVLQLWHGWAGEYADAFAEVIKEFNRTHPDIYVKPLFMPTGAGENMKFLTAVAAGAPPDLIVADGTQVASWADMGILRPLDDRLAAADMTADDFWGPSWDQCRYNGRTWAVSAAADANFALLWNKHLFRVAGLDPENPPRTFEELYDYCEKLTQYGENGRIVTLEELQQERGFKNYNGNGRIVQVGLIPTYAYSAENAILTWGWAFGGSFYNAETRAFTCDDPKVIATLQWFIDMRDLYGGKRKIAAFDAGFGDATQHPFFSGKLAMHVAAINETQNITKFAPNLEYGIGPLPAPEGGEYGSAWIGGWTLAIPYGDRGNEDAAFELIKWLTVDPGGTAYTARRMKLLPACKDSPFFEKDVPDDPILREYFNILKKAKHARPITPVNMYYMNQLRRAVSRTMQNRDDEEDQLTPEKALREARRETEEHAAKLHSKTKARYTQ